MNININLDGETHAIIKRDKVNHSHKSLRDTVECLIKSTIIKNKSKEEQQND